MTARAHCSGQINLVSIRMRVISEGATLEFRNHASVEHETLQLVHHRSVVTKSKLLRGCVGLNVNGVNTIRLIYLFC